MAAGFVKAVEGGTTLLVPELSLTAKVPPKTPAFFNPAAKLNRDLSVLAYRAIAPSLPSKTFADSFTGIGARALRVAAEVPEIEQVYGNDINSIAIGAAKEAAELNSVAEKCHFSINEVCKFLLHGDSDEERFGIVDLDPFGTPARHIDCVLRAVLGGGLVSVTATDTAVLCGVYPEVCVRRYYGRPLNNSYGNEVALRLLLSLMALTASRLELAIRPVFVHATMHYLRVYATVSVSSSEANDVYSNIGYIMHCFNCGHRFMAREYDGKSKCELCASALRVGGQLWTGPFHDKEFVKKMLEQNPDSKCKKVLDASFEEISEVPYYFKADEISSKLKTNPHSVQRIIEKLQSAGFAASKTPLNTSAFKTNASINQILDVLK
ncbi:MAG TPA: tRNA (guanine(10)-N(2))-dimethyltransferase [Nitrososphaera sp.]|nr:tRNA (guanine(10)-N(2))-dimethyltransferase [Nitrososphaera sp.]HEX2615557.1 tRNA (guanine(10)-N(2))-dimethyltransferase [Nitrososphaera sp.]